MNKSRMDQPDYILDIKGRRISLPEGSQSAANSGQTQKRNWLAIHWRCCETYGRIYKSRDGKHYDGRCPRCGKHVKVPIGPSGTHARFFEAW